MCLGYRDGVLTEGAQVAGYRIDRVIGTGPTGTTYLARQGDPSRDAALTIIDADLVEDPAARQRIVQDAAAATDLKHPGIVAVYGAGTTDEGLSWIAAQYVPGTDAETALRQGSMTPARAVRTVSAVALVLDAAHQSGMVHRNVRPANFLLSDGPEEQVLLNHAGSAAAGQPSDVTYAAPELLKGEPADGRADLYSLGCSLFRLLTGRPPFAVDPAAAVQQHLYAPPPKVTDFAAQLPPALNAVVAKAMAKDPAERYQTGREFAAAATATLPERHLPTLTAPPPPAAAPPAPATTPPAAPPPAATPPIPEPPVAQAPTPPPVPQPILPAVPIPVPTPPPPPRSEEPTLTATPAPAPAKTWAPPSDATVPTNVPPAAEPRQAMPAASPAPPAAPPPPWHPAPDVDPFDQRNFPAPAVGRRPGRQPATIAAAAAAVVALGIGGVVWLTSRDSGSPEDSSVAAGQNDAPSSATAGDTPTPAPRDPVAEADLQRLLPPGYPPGACTPGDPTAGARATVACTPNRDPGGPSSARYSLMPAQDALQRAFNDVVASSTTVICPGNIMSPGAWRRNATPQLAAGTVFCGTTKDGSVVAWTTDDKLLLNVVNTTANGPTLEQLFSWWSSHS